MTNLLNISKINLNNKLITDIDNEEITLPLPKTISEDIYYFPKLKKNSLLTEASLPLSFNLKEDLDKQGTSDYKNKLVTIEALKDLNNISEPLVIYNMIDEEDPTNIYKVYQFNNNLPEPFDENINTQSLTVGVFQNIITEPIKFDNYTIYEGNFITDKVFEHNYISNTLSFDKVFYLNKYDNFILSTSNKAKMAFTNYSGDICRGFVKYDYINEKVEFYDEVINKNIKIIFQFNYDTTNNYIDFNVKWYDNNQKYAIIKRTSNNILEYIKLNSETQTVEKENDAFDITALNLIINDANDELIITYDSHEYVDLKIVDDTDYKIKCILFGSLDDVYFSMLNYIDIYDNAYDVTYEDINENIINYNETINKYAVGSDYYIVTEINEQNYIDKFIEHKLLTTDSIKNSYVYNKEYDKTWIENNKNKLMTVNSNFDNIIEDMIVYNTYYSKSMKNVKTDDNDSKIPLNQILKTKLNESDIDVYINDKYVLSLINKGDLIDSAKFYCNYYVDDVIAYEVYDKYYNFKFRFVECKAYIYVTYDDYATSELIDNSTIELKYVRCINNENGKFATNIECKKALIAKYLNIDDDYYEIDYIGNYYLNKSYDHYIDDYTVDDLVFNAKFLIIGDEVKFRKYTDNINNIIIEGINANNYRNIYFNKNIYSIQFDNNNVVIKYKD